jgi:ferric enterobactin receptor
VRNKDINALLSWKMTPQQILDFSYAYSRQGNIYAGDTQYSNGNLSPDGLVASCTATKPTVCIASPGG